MEKAEQSVICCKHCNQVKTRYLDGNFPNKKDKRWTNESGQQWSGRVCAECVVEKARLRQKNKRNQNKIIKAAMESK